MKTVLRVLLISVIVALINLGLTFTGSVDLVWCVSVAMALAGMEDETILFAVISGTLFDIMVHGNIGISAISLLVPMVLFILIRAVGLGERTWQKGLIAFIWIFLAFWVRSLLLGLLGEGVVIDLSHFEYLAKGTLVNLIVTVVVYGGISLFKDKFTTRSVVKL